MFLCHVWINEENKFLPNIWKSLQDLPPIAHKVQCHFRNTRNIETCSDYISRDYCDLMDVYNNKKNSHLFYRYSFQFWEYKEFI